MSQDEKLPLAQPSETERFLADTIEMIEGLDALDLQTVEPATVFVAKGDGA
jgi:hypothetical protein